MNDEVTNILEEFSDFLEITNPITYMLRWIGWVIIKGLALLVDALSNITDTILGIKLFFADEAITSLVVSMRPFLVVLMAFSICYTGYLLIFQKKFDREKVLTNIFVTLGIIVLLGQGMNQANRFTDEAINALDVNGEGTLSQKIVKDNMTDLTQFDITGWQTTELEYPNKISGDRILKINITQAIDGDFLLSGNKISETGREVFNSRLEYDDLGNPKKVELNNGWFTAFKEKYYRWDWNFWSIAITLGVMAFTMLTIAIKLAKLFFELAFNYVLATIIAPADIHSGQKTKKIIENISSIFVSTIMIFLSLKIYIIGTLYITEKMEGISYLIALFAFSLAVIDGPNIVERLFGIDAGLKSGWGALAGGYATAKGAIGVAKGTVGGLKNISSATKSAGLKGLSGVASVAGMARGLNSRRNEQEQNNQKGQIENSSQGNYSTTSNAGENSEPGSGGFEEIITGMNQVVPSLEQEMRQEQDQKRNNIPENHKKIINRSYQIGKTKGETLRKNIVNYRNKDGKS